MTTVYISRAWGRFHILGTTTSRRRQNLGPFPTGPCEGWCSRVTEPHSQARPFPFLSTQQQHQGTQLSSDFHGDFLTIPGSGKSVGRSWVEQGHWPGSRSVVTDEASWGRDSPGCMPTQPVLRGFCAGLQSFEK